MDYYASQAEKNLEDVNNAIESYTTIMEYDLGKALEGTNIDAYHIFKQRLSEVKAMKAEMNDYAARGQYDAASKKAADISLAFKEYQKMLDELEPSATSAAIIDIALLIITLVVAATAAFVTIKLKKKEIDAAGTKRFNEVKDAGMLALKESRRDIQADALKQHLGPLGSSMFATQKKYDAAFRAYGENDPRTQALRRLLDAQTSKSAGIIRSAGTIDRVKEIMTDSAKMMVQGINVHAEFEASAVIDAGKKAAGKLGALIGSTSAGALLVKLGVIHHSKVDPERPLNANDFNALISMLKKDCVKGQKYFMKLSYDYHDLAKLPTMESNVEYIYRNIDIACENNIHYMAMEGVNIDALKLWKQRLSEVNAAKKEIKAAEKAGDYAKAALRARECAETCRQLSDNVYALEDSIASAAIVNILFLIILLTIANAAERAARRVTYSAIFSNKVSNARKAVQPFGITVETDRKFFPTQATYKVRTDVDESVKRQIGELFHSAFANKPQHDKLADTIARLGKLASVSAIAGVLMANKTSLPKDQWVGINDWNVMINAIKQDFSKVISGMEEDARYYEAMAQRAADSQAAEAWLLS